MKVQPKVGHSDSQQLGAGSHPQTREYLDLINRTNNQLNAIKSHEKLAGPPQTQVSSLPLFISLCQLPKFSHSQQSRNNLAAQTLKPSERTANIHNFKTKSNSTMPAPHQLV